MTRGENHPVLPCSGPSLAEASRGCLPGEGITPGVRESRTAEGASYISELEVSGSRTDDSRKRSSVADVGWIFLELRFLFSFLCAVCPSDLSLEESEFSSQQAWVFLHVI